MSCTVCIVGAGVAGLKAARELVEAGIPPAEIVILEAQDRIGGRIKTIVSGSNKYDLGASWFHDFLTNSVLHENIADGTLAPSDGYFDDKTQLYYDENGPVDAGTLKLEQVRHEIGKFIELHYASAVDVPDTSLDAIVQSFLDRFWSFLGPEQRQYAGPMMRYLELWFGITSDVISAKYAALNHAGRNLFNRKGFSFLIDKLARDLHVRRNEPVTCINRDTLCVHTASGVVRPRYIVVAVPQSILALEEGHENGITWIPSLPRPVREAINDVHFGALGKVILEFDSVFWPQNEDRFEVFPKKMDPVQKRDPLVPLAFEYPLAFINHIPISGAKTLICLVQSPLTDFLESNPQEAWPYLKPMVQVLAVDKKPVPDPKKVIVTDWTRNPYSRGSYTALHVGDDPSGLFYQLSGEFDVCGLGADSKIRFAGEHTISDGAGCVHGAYESGRRAAQWIIQDMESGTPRELVQ